MPALPLIVFIGLAVFYILWGWPNPDEGFYGMAAREVWHGALPYRDFGYPQLPLLPYLNGMLMGAVGFGFFEQRTVNAPWALLTLVVLLVTARQLRSAPLPALGTSLALAGSLGWIHYCCMGKTHAAAGLFMSLGGACLLWRQAPYAARCGVFAISAATALGIRLSVAPTLAVLAVGLAFQGPSWRARLLALLAPAFLATACALPFYAAAPEEFLFWNWRYQLASTLDRRNLQIWIQHYIRRAGCLDTVVRDHGGGFARVAALEGANVLRDVRRGNGLAGAAGAA